MHHIELGTAALPGRWPPKYSLQSQCILREQNFETVLTLATTQRKADVVAALCELGCDVNAPRYTHCGTPLHIAAGNADSESMRTLLAHGAHVDGPTRDDELPMHAAAKSGSPEPIKILHEFGADANPRRQDGRTPVSLAAEVGSAEAIQALYDCGADLNRQDKQLCTPLIHAATWCCFKAVDKLLELGAHVSPRNEEGLTAFQCNQSLSAETIFSRVR
eukprot:c19574_g1_i3.p1 GENE.c19574_g1_i3~~c19574_g1_i3.p1  ORF type:complete len:219 (+),score=23.65 c19574_g1_i3:159-815(+)